MILVLALVVAVFAIDNAAPVTVHFLIWSLPRMGLALVILISALLGAMLGVAVGVSQLFRERRTHRQEMVTVPVPPHEGIVATPSPAPSVPAPDLHLPDVGAAVSEDAASPGGPQAQEHAGPESE